MNRATSTAAGAPHILARIPFRLHIADLAQSLHGAAAREEAEELATLIDEAHHIGRPRALYLASSVDDRGDDWVDLDGVRFTSRVLRVNLDTTYRVFPYVVTSGRELHDWAQSQPDLLREYWAQVISEVVLRQAAHTLTTHLEETYELGPTARMNPGSLDDWPLEQQRPLFELFRGGEERIGVELTEHLLMEPTKTVSGILYGTDLLFESCQLCAREICPGRRSQYSPELWATRYTRAAPD